MKINFTNSFALIESQLLAVLMDFQVPMSGLHVKDRLGESGWIMAAVFCSKANLVFITCNCKHITSMKVGKNSQAMEFYYASEILWFTMKILPIPAELMS